MSWESSASRRDSPAPRAAWRGPRRSPAPGPASRSACAPSRERRRRGSTAARRRARERRGQRQHLVRQRRRTRGTTPRGRPADRDLLDAAGIEGHAAGQAGPLAGQGVLQLGGRRRQRTSSTTIADSDESSRSKQRLGQQPVAARQIHDPAASEQAPHAPGHLPRLEQLLARQASRGAHRPPQPIEQRPAGKPPQVVRRQPIPRRAIESPRRFVTCCILNCELRVGLYLFTDSPYTSIRPTFTNPPHPWPLPGSRSANPTSSTRLRSGATQA